MTDSRFRTHDSARFSEQIKRENLCVFVKQRSKATGYEEEKQHLDCVT